MVKQFLISIMRVTANLAHHGSVAWAAKETVGSTKYRQIISHRREGYNSFLFNSSFPSSLTGGVVDHSLDRYCTPKCLCHRWRNEFRRTLIHKEVVSKFWPFSLESNIVFITQECKQIFSGKERETALSLLFGHVFGGKHFLSLIHNNAGKSEHIC